MTDDYPPLVLSYIYEDWENTVEFLMDFDAFDPEYEV